jgi:hypothetical protein
LSFDENLDSALERVYSSVRDPAYDYLASGFQHSLKSGQSLGMLDFVTTAFDADVTRSKLVVIDLKEITVSVSAHIGRFSRFMFDQSSVGQYGIDAAVMAAVNLNDLVVVDTGSPR